MNKSFKLTPGGGKELKTFLDGIIALPAFIVFIIIGLSIGLALFLAIKSVLGFII